MKFVFFGTPEFAAIVLEKLLASGFVPTAVVCNPDKPVGRKKIITPPAVKESIVSQVSSIKHGIKILQPENVSELVTSGYLIPDTFDFFVVASYGKILSKEILAIPKLGTIGVHPSLLPKYRGPSPIQSAILSGDEETGVTLYLVDKKTDHGPIVSSIKYRISSADNFRTLTKKLAELGGKLLTETLPKFLKSEIKPVPQDESRATFTKKFERRDAFVEPEELAAAEEGNRAEAEEIDRKVRAFDPEPGAWTIRNGKQVKLLEAEAKDGKLKLKKIQIEGERPKKLVS